ncbi:GntR family transcriptional regulator [Peptoniphilus sp. GNH]|nr:GntR family transcriptional regulator [Peptoniphilus sp. GNH]
MENSLPIYVQVANYIKGEIISGKFKPGSLCPSTNELSKLFNINPATAGKGLNILVDENIVYKKRGIGMVVSDNGKALALEIKKNDFYESYLPFLSKEMKSLGISLDELVKKLKELTND